MYSEVVRREALAQLAAGGRLGDVASRVGVNRSTLRAWRDADPERAPRRPCPLCDDIPVDGAAYAHLLGLYLGDGCISTGARGVHALRIACANAYPGLIDECERSVGRVRPGAVCRVRSQGCVYVTSYWTHWPCLFPQHGPGRKHERRIALAEWQRELVEQHPGRFLRGLFHSYGCRITNWATKTVGTGAARTTKRYEYPRYFFTNHSPEIIDLCAWALDLLGVAYRRPKAIHISVARGEAVALLDQHVGPKS